MVVAIWEDADPERRGGQEPLTWQRAQASEGLADLRVPSRFFLPGSKLLGFSRGRRIFFGGGWEVGFLWKSLLWINQASR